MKTITLINWIIIALYVVYAIVIYIDTHRPGIDAAGKGMAMGFLFIGLMYLAILIGLNFIDVKWVRILVLVSGGIPLIYLVINSILALQNNRNYSQSAAENAKIEDPHFNAMMMTILNSDLKEMEALLAKDKSQINQVGAYNRQSLLAVAVRNSWTSENPEASAMVHLILKNGGDPNVFHPDSYAPLAAHGVYLDLTIFKALLEAGANSTALNEQSIPLLYTLIERGRDDCYEKVDLLLQYGLDPNLPMGNAQPYQLNYSPLVWAAHYERWTVCRLLIENGADLEFKPPGPDGRTFRDILDEKGEVYREARNVPEGYQDLMVVLGIVEGR